MTSSQLNSFATVVSSLETVRNEAVSARNDLAAIYGHLPLEDPRRVTARHIKAVISSAYLSALHLEESMTRPEWWERTFGKVPLAIKDELEDFATLLAANLAVFPLGLFENGLRRLVRVMDASACSGGTAEFKSIYEWFFSRLGASGWSYTRGDPRPFLDVARNVRNTIHNNGYFRPPSQRATDVAWRGGSYNFVVGSLPPFVDWNFHWTSLSELIALNHAVMAAPLVFALPPIAG